MSSLKLPLPPPPSSSKSSTSLVPLATPSPADFTSKLSAIRDRPDGEDAEPKKKRKRRWGDESQELLVGTGMPTMLPASMSVDEQQKYIFQVQIEELCRKLRSGDLGIPERPEDRSPSPEPIYNNEGKRTNTREVRVRRKLEEERHVKIQQLLLIFPEYKPPHDYKAPTAKITEKVFIPQDEHPEVNFIGLIIGPRGNTLKMLEKETACKIIIRGKGSVKEGKIGKIPGQAMPGEDEPLHAYITGTVTECVHKAMIKIKEVIKQGIEVPDSENDLRKKQLRELALLNGTLREGDMVEACSNCGCTGHKSWQCTERPNLTQNIVCASCGNSGHIAKDCLMKRPGFFPGSTLPGPHDKNKMDAEYMSFMSELTGDGPKPSMMSTAQTRAPTRPQMPQGLTPTWARPQANTLNSTPWQQQQQQQQPQVRMFTAAPQTPQARFGGPSLLGNPRPGWGMPGAPQGQNPQWQQQQQQQPRIQSMGFQPGQGVLGHRPPNNNHNQQPAQNMNPVQMLAQLAARLAQQGGGGGAPRFNNMGPR